MNAVLKTKLSFDEKEEDKRVKIAGRGGLGKALKKEPNNTHCNGGFKCLT